MNVKINNSWKKELQEEFKKDYFIKLASFVRQEYLNKKVYPKPENIFQAFELCPFNKVKLVLLGQDPYHGPGQAHGLSFSVQHGINNPPSLQNIFKEIENDLQIKMSGHGNLSNWAKQGVLLLNATLTVIARQAGSHQNKGWEKFTDSVIKTISDKKENIVFLLWGSYAQSKKPLINPLKHLILTAPHPSPLSAYRGFFGCRHFSQANDYFLKTNQTPINWKI